MHTLRQYILAPMIAITGHSVIAGTVDYAWALPKPNFDVQTAAPEGALPNTTECSRYSLSAAVEFAGVEICGDESAVDSKAFDPVVQVDSAEFIFLFRDPEEKSLSAPKQSYLEIFSLPTRPELDTASKNPMPLYREE